MRAFPPCQWRQPTLMSPPTRSSSAAEPWAPGAPTSCAAAASNASSSSRRTGSGRARAAAPPASSAARAAPAGRSSWPSGPGTSTSPSRPSSASTPASPARATSCRASPRPTSPPRTPGWRCSAPPASTSSGSTATAADAMNPTMAPGSTLGGTYFADDGYITPPRNVLAYAVALAQAGVEVREDTAFTGLRVDGRSGDPRRDLRRPDRDRPGRADRRARSSRRSAPSPASGSRSAASATRSP